MAHKRQRIRNPWQKAIKTALVDFQDEKKGIQAGEALFAIGTELVAAATDRFDPNFQFAVREIGLRLDGKPTENIQIGNTGDAPATVLGISAVYAQLIQLTGNQPLANREVAVQNRPVLSTEVRPEKDGHGETVDIQSMPDGTE